MQAKIKLDVIFLIDVTGSMGRLLNTARKFLKNSLVELEKTGVDLTASLVLYRDHPPQDRSFASMVAVDCGTPADVDKFMTTSKHFQAGGGGDAPESGLDAINDMKSLNLRSDALHKAFLIGDAPLHGTPYGSGGQVPTKCKCGLTNTSVVGILENTSVDLTGVLLNSYAETERSFASVCSTLLHSSDNKSMSSIFDALKTMCDTVKWCVDVLLVELRKDPFAPVSALAKALDVSVDKVTDGIETLNLLEMTQEFV